MITLLRSTIGSLIVVGLVFTSANAAEIKLKATLTAAAEVPPTTSKGTGTAEVTINDATREVSWKVTYQGLTGPVTAAHIHGPANAPDINAGIFISFGVAPFKNPIEGKAVTSQAQIDDILAGKTYVNLHTDANKVGEIRGQLTK